MSGVDRWEELKAIFEAALAKKPEDRVRFLDHACSGDQALHSQLMRLLASHLKGESFFEHPPVVLDNETVYSRCENAVFSRGQIVCGRFVIEEFLGSGGMGQVYSARDTELNDEIALKVLNSVISRDPKSVGRFIREVQLARRITHPNVCRIFDIANHRVNNDQEFHVLTMQLIHGETLARYLQKVGRVEYHAALPVVEQMCLALEAAHNQGIVHRDFKPSNIIVGRRLDRVHLVVTDFGLACLATRESELSSITVTGGIVGTPDYMAPEQLSRGEATAQSDIYALGLVMFEVVTGKRPFPGSSTMARAVMRLSDEPINPRDLTRELPLSWESTILRCLERDPSHRFRSALEVIDSLQSETGSRRRRSKKLALPLRRTVSFVVAGIIVVALFLFGLRFLKETAVVPAGSQLLVTEVETPEPELQGITAAFKSQLSQSEHFETVAEDRVRELLKQMGVTSNAMNDARVIRELALRAGASIVVYGSVSRLGGEYVFEVKLERVGSAPTLVRRSWKNEFSASSKRELFDGVHQAATWVRETVGESL